MSINKFTNNMDETPLHSSGYAEVARKNKIGVFSPQSFNQRLHIERNRQSVGRYHDSMLANGHHRNLHYQRMNTSATPSRPNGNSQQPDANARLGQRPTGGLIADVVKPAQRQGFTEPPARSYNPYK